MDAVQFKAAVRGLNGFTQEMIDEVCSLGDAMNDTQRDQYLAQFQEANAQLVQTGKAAVDASQAVVGAFKDVNQQVRKTERNVDEAQQSQASMKKAEDEMNTL